MFFYLLFSHDPEEGLEDDRETRRSYRQPRGYKARYRSSSKKVSDLFFLKCQYNYKCRVMIISCIICLFYSITPGGITVVSKSAKHMNYKYRAIVIDCRLREIRKSHFAKYLFQM